MSEKEKNTTTNTTETVIQKGNQQKGSMNNNVEKSVKEEVNLQNLLQKFQATPVLLLSLMAGCAVALVWSMLGANKDFLFHNPHYNLYAQIYIDNLFTGGVGLWHILDTLWFAVIIILLVTIVCYGILIVSYYMDREDTESKSHEVRKGLKLLSVTAIIAALVTVPWGIYKTIASQSYNNSQAASCFNMSAYTNYVDGKCTLTSYIVAVDSVFAYSDSSRIVKEENGQFVEGIEYTVAEGNKSYNSSHKPGDKVFIPSSDFSEEGKSWDTAVYDVGRSDGYIAAYLKNEAFRDNPNYVIHMVKKEHTFPIVDGSPLPNWDSVDDLKVNIDGVDYLYRKNDHVDTPYIHVSDSESIMRKNNRELPLMVPAEIMEKK